jgi:pSer/pThr/pTyr-binding forkhead associated (FHA) protein
MHLRVIGTDGGATEQVVTALVVRLGRDPNSEVFFDSDTYPMVSGRHAKIEQVAAACVLTPLS